MILRLLRARVIEGEEARLTRFVRDEAVAHALGVPGLVSFQPAVRETESGAELIIVSTWTGFDHVAAAGQDLDMPVTMPGAASMLQEGRAEHYELVIGEARALPLRKARLRLTRIRIKPNAESAYYGAVRQWADHLLDETGLVTFTLGRRVVGSQDDIVAVQIWQDEAALRDVAGPHVDQPMGRRELSEFWATEPTIEHFDALTSIEARPNAPAILVADDNRRYVHATPAAARLAGRPLARLLTMRVEDMARRSDRKAVPDAWDRFMSDGEMAGPYILQRPDGSEVSVRFAAKANSPWHGAHASVLVEDGNAEELDVDRALVDAGLVVRASA